MNKKVIIDFEKSLDPFSGLGQFLLFLKNEFDKNHNIDFNYYIQKNKLLKKLNLGIPPGDVFHAIHQDSPFIPNKKTKFILTIHDFNAIYENHNPDFQKKYLNQLQKKVNRADVITFISEFTKNETLKYLDLKDKELKVIYNGISLPTNSTKPITTPSKKFFFTIGTVVPKKNFHVLIDMMKYFPDYELIIAGTTFHKYAKEIMAKIEDEKLHPQIKLVGTIANEEKKWYYENASAFLFPSTLEGFGLPVAEAMSLGLPLFLSNLTSLPEVGGNDAFYFENFKAINMAEVIMNGLQVFNDNQKNRLIENSTKFSWEKAAHKYIEIYLKK